MPKSKYPIALDTSIEIPPVRDNITEIGSDVINSLRSAIFKIETTLGINPHGSPGNSVATRISKSIDENGNLLQEALLSANVLSGPILDSDVSKVASISESKLKLDFPTTLLQSEISIINNSLGLVKNSLESLSAGSAIHTDASALNSHSGNSIGISSANLSKSDLATLSLAAGTLQGILEEIYSSHINYSGLNISSINNSHSADQIYYDTINTGNIISSNSLQGAIDELANVEKSGFKSTIENISSNGLIRSGQTFDAFEGNNIGSLLMSSSSASYIQSAGLTTTTFSLTVGQTPIDNISEFDILTLSGSTNVSDNKDYQIANVTLDGSGLIQEVTVYGGPLGDSESGLSIVISKSTHTSYNLGGFSSVVRPRANKTNTPDIQILNPDSATIVSYGICPSKITSTNDSFDIIIDSNAAVTITTFNSSIAIQTLDSIAQSINDQAVDQHLNITAFKVRTGNGFELAISHNMPNINGDVINRTIVVSLGSSNDGTSELGLSSILDTVVEGISGNSLSLNGSVLSEFGLIRSFDNSRVEIVSSVLSVSLFETTFALEGIRVGDLAIITGSTSPSDDGTYRIGSILGSSAELDLSGTTFSGVLGDSSMVHFVRATSNVGEMTFEETSSTDGTILFDTFLSEDKNIFHSKRLEVDGSLRNGPFFGAIADISKNFITSNQTASLRVTTGGYAILTGPNSQDGAPVFVGGTGIYEVLSSDGLSFVRLDVNASGPPTIEKAVTLYGFDEVDKKNYRLSRGGFSTSLGRILGDSTNPGIPTLLDKRVSGTADASIVGDSFVERFVEGPRNDLRGSGIVRGCIVSNATYTNTGTEIYQTFNVGAGVAIVNGIRFEFPGVEGFRIDTPNDFYIAINNYGSIIAREVIDNPNNPGENISPFFQLEVATLSLVENDSTNATSTDLRLLIDNLDFKVVKNIIVAKDSRFGHFTDIGKAIDYSRRFIQMFPTMGSPSVFISNGVHEVSSTILLDFDISISGCGPGTILVKAGSLASGSVLSGDDIDLGTSLFMIGGGSNVNSLNIQYGVSLRDFSYQTNDSLLSNVGCVISITQPLVKNSVEISRVATYKIDGITFNGPSTIDGGATDPNKIGEYALVIGQQDPSSLVSENNLEMGNVIVTNCRMHRMGLEHGAIKFTESSSSTMKNVVVSGNIATMASPNVVDTNSVLIEYPTAPSVENFVEVGNSVRANN